MFTLEFLDGERANADEKGWKVIDIMDSGVEVKTTSETASMRPGRTVFGVYHGERSFSLSFASLVRDNVAYAEMIDAVHFYFLRDEPFYLYLDYRSKSERSGVPARRILVNGKSVKYEKNGLKVQFTVELESYELPYFESTSLQHVNWEAKKQQFQNLGGARIDPRYCQMKATVKVTGAGSDLKISFDDKPYFWYKKATRVGDVFVIDGTDMRRNGENCFADCYKRTTFLKVGNNSISVDGSTCEIQLEFRYLYL